MLDRTEKKRGSLMYLHAVNSYFVSNACSGSKALKRAKLIDPKHLSGGAVAGSIIRCLPAKFICIAYKTIIHLSIDRVGLHFG